MWHTIIIVGNLGRDPEMRYTPSGAAVTSFSVASTRQYNSNAGQPVKETCWFRISVWGKQAETCNQYLKKGSKVLVEGRITPDPATGSPKIYTKKDGTNGANYDVTATFVKFMSTRAEGEAPGAAAEEAGAPAATEDEIPF
jgi:single-strand DNA-binding protein